MSIMTIKSVLIRKTDSPRWQGYKEAGTLEHCSECKAVQLLWNSMAVPQRLNIELLYVPGVSLLGTIP